MAPDYSGYSGDLCAKVTAALGGDYWVAALYRHFNGTVDAVYRIVHKSCDRPLLDHNQIEDRIAEALRTDDINYRRVVAQRASGIQLESELAGYGSRFGSFLDISPEVPETISTFSKQAISSSLQTP